MHSRTTPRLRLLLIVTVALLLVLAAITAGLMAAGLLPTPSFLARRPGPTPIPADTREGRWQQDIDYLAEQLPYLHANAYFKTHRETFQQQAADLRAAVPTSTDAQIGVGMMRLVASIGDGHTRTLPHWSINFRMFPVRAYWFSDGLYVVAAAPEFTQTLGAKITRIGQTEIQVAFEAVRPLVSADNEQEVLNNSPLYLATPEILNGLGILPETERGAFTFEPTNGEAFTLELPAVAYEDYPSYVTLYDQAGAQRPLYERDRDKFYWYEYLPDSQTLFVKYNVCDDMPGKPFSEFVKEMFAVVDNQPVQRLILDLRHNGGGNEGVLSPFIDAILARPALNAADKFFVFIGRETFSSAMQNAITLNNRTNATLVGEPTGGKPNHYGEVRQFRLPNSGLRVQYSTRYWVTVRDSDPPSVAPEIEAAPNIADMLAGRDPALVAALNSR